MKESENMKEQNKLYFLDENNEQQEYDVIFSFYSKNANKNYLFATDYSLDDTGELNVYAFFVKPGSTQIEPLEDPEELDTVNKIIEKYQSSKEEKEESENPEETY